MRQWGICRSPETPVRGFSVVDGTGEGSGRRRGRPIAAIVVLAAGLAPTGLSAGCQTDGATYRMLGDGGPEIVMRKATGGVGASDLDLVLTVPGQAAPFRFQPIQSQGFGSTFAVPVPPETPENADDAPREDTLTEMPGRQASSADPFGDADFPLALFATGADGRLVPYEDGADHAALPGPASPAPDAIFIAQLASNLWYGTNDGDVPVILAQEIWYLDCK